MWYSLPIWLGRVRDHVLPACFDFSCQFQMSHSSAKTPFILWVLKCISAWWRKCLLIICRQITWIIFYKTSPLISVYFSGRNVHYALYAKKVANSCYAWWGRCLIHTALDSHRATQLPVRWTERLHHWQNPSEELPCLSFPQMPHGRHEPRG